MGLFDQLKMSGKSLEEIAKEAKAKAESESAFSEEQTDLPTETDFYCVRLTPTQDVGLFDSKIGGIPYWDSRQEYPTDENGKPMALLCQINFDRESLDDERLMTKGILQFFIATDASCNGTVVYHEIVDETVTQDEVLRLCPPVMPLNDGGFSPVKTVCCIALERQSEETTADGHKIFGTPAFCQEDPREALSQEKTDYYNTLLLQIDSEFGGDGPVVLWGDSGVGNFFIIADALKARDFSDVLFNWDCF